MKIYKVNLSQSSLFMEIEGHPTEILDKARQIAHLLLDSGPWFFTAINFQSPLDRKLGTAMKDDKWLGKITARNKSQQVFSLYSDGENINEIGN